MPENQAANNIIHINPNLLSFKPRQVLLLSNPPTMKQTNDKKRTSTLKPERKTLLLHSIAKYLETTGGFSKTLKKFKSEAKFEKDDDLGGGLLFDLEEAFCKFLEKSDGTSNRLETDKVQEIHANGISKRDRENGSADVETVSNKKKKKSDSNATDKELVAGDKVINAESVPELITNDTVPTEVKPEEKKKKKKSDSHGQEEQVSIEAVNEPADNIVYESPDKKHKDKKKKKSNLDSKSLVDNIGHHPSEATEERSKDMVFSEGNKVTDSETENKPKDKKKKKNKPLSDPSNGNVELHISDSKHGTDAVTKLDVKNVESEGKKKKRKGGVVSENLSGEIPEGKLNKFDSEKDDSKNSEEGVSDKQDKSSKKRKRLASEDDAAQPADIKAIEESKRRKTESSEETKGNGQANGNLDEYGEKSATQKTVKKQINGSVELKTVKHFQRVKVDEVVFSDERLKDNSYWAKNGAEEGYGAKAQEILGQVRGRGFRHEKTKKKRGSYRGGQIDAKSHSIKFNYSDEE